VTASWWPTVGVVWDLKTRQVDLVLAGHAQPVRLAGFSPDGTRIVTGGGDGQVKLWDAVTGDLIFTIRARENVEFTTGCQFSPDGQRLAISGGATAAWGEPTWIYHAPLPKVGSVSAAQANETKDKPAPTGLTVGPYAERIIAAHRAILSKAWDEADRVLEACPVAERAWEWDYLVHQAAQGRRSGTPEKPITLRGHTRFIWNAPFSPDGNTLVTGSGDMTVRVWNTLTGRLQLALADPNKDQEYAHFRGVVLSPTGMRIAAAGGMGDGANTNVELKLWSFPNSRLIHALRGHTSYCGGVAFSPDGSLLASASADSTIRIWKSQTGQAGPVLKVHSDAVAFVTFSRHGNWIASAGTDGVVKLWNVRTFEEEESYSGHSAEVNYVAFSPERRRLVSSFGGGYRS
jgi:WD40 repeat protein